MTTEPRYGAFRPANEIHILEGITGRQRGGHQTTPRISTVYYDCTDETEFLYDCILQTIEFDLPREIDYLKRHDDLVRRIINAFEFPGRTAEDIIMLIRRNGGVFPKERRKKEFARLTETEVPTLEIMVAEGVAGFDQQ